MRRPCEGCGEGLFVAPSPKAQHRRGPTQEVDYEGVRYNFEYNMEVGQ